MINAKAEVHIYSNIRAPGGGECIAIDEGSVDAFKANPDLFAARHFGATVDEYREWIEFDGTPLCGHRTKAGKLCSLRCGRSQMIIRDFLAMHRVYACGVHSEKGINFKGVIREHLD